MLVEQAALPDDCFLDPRSLTDDRPGPAAVSVSGCHVAEALRGAAVVLVVDELADSLLVYV